MKPKGEKGYKPIGFLGKIERAAKAGIAAANIVVGGTQAGEMGKYFKDPKTANPISEQVAINYMEHKLQKRGKEGPNTLHTEDQDPQTLST